MLSKLQNYICKDSMEAEIGCVFKTEQEIPDNSPGRLHHGRKRSLPVRPPHSGCRILL